MAVMSYTVFCTLTSSQSHLAVELLKHTTTHGASFTHALTLSQMTFFKKVLLHTHRLNNPSVTVSLYSSAVGGLSNSL